MLVGRLRATRRLGTFFASERVMKLPTALRWVSLICAAGARRQASLRSASIELVAVGPFAALALPPESWTTSFDLRQSSPVFRRRASRDTPVL